MARHRHDPSCCFSNTPRILLLWRLYSSCSLIWRGSVVFFVLDHVFANVVSHHFVVLFHLCLCDKNTLTQSNVREEGACAAYHSRLQSLLMKTKAGTQAAGSILSQEQREGNAPTLLTATPALSAFLTSCISESSPKQVPSMVVCVFLHQLIITTVPLRPT